MKTKQELIEGLKDMIANQGVTETGLMEYDLHDALRLAQRLDEPRECELKPIKRWPPVWACTDCGEKYGIMELPDKGRRFPKYCHECGSMVKRGAP
jgi:hypothetical protein